VIKSKADRHILKICRSVFYFLNSRKEEREAVARRKKRRYNGRKDAKGEGFI